MELESDSQLLSSSLVDDRGVFCGLALEGGTFSFLGTPILVCLDILILTTLPPFKKSRVLACLVGGVGKYPTFTHCCQDKRGIFKK